MLKMQFIQTMALINVIRLIRIGLLLFFKIMFLCKNMPCASTTQLSKPSWSTLNIWRHLVDLRWAFSLLWAGLARGSGAGGLQGCSSALHSHPLSASQTKAKGKGRHQAVPRQTPHAPNSCLGSAAWGGSSWTPRTSACWGSPGSCSSFISPDRECCHFGSHRDRAWDWAGNRRVIISTLLLLGWPHGFWHGILKWFFTSLNHIALVGLDKAWGHPDCSVSPSVLLP